MDKLHASRVDNWLLLLVVSVAMFVLLASALIALSGLALLALLFFLLAAVLPMWVVMATRYHITNDELRVRAGPFRWRIMLADIQQVEPCHSARPAPAMSQQRLRLTYGDGHQLLISPEDRYQFIFDLGIADPEMEDE